MVLLVPLSSRWMGLECSQTGMNGGSVLACMEESDAFPSEEGEGEAKYL